MPGEAPSPARPHVLALVDYYLPGYKAGGPLRTLENIVAHLGGEVRFTILTRDRDLGDTGPYPGLDGPVTRRSVAGAQVVYLSPAALAGGALEDEIRRARPDVLYLNSLFSPAFTLRPLLARRRGRLPRVPVVLAPRGELSPGALALKRTKKRVFLAVARAAGLYRGVAWQASAEEEAREIRRWFGAGEPVFVAPDLPPRVPHAAPPPREKRPGTLRAVFLSRISPKKNLDGALQLLAGIEGDVRFDVYGPEEDAAHAARCRALAATLAPGVDVRFHGPIPPEEVPGRLAEAHVFLFPTHGENFGHVILESLLAGCIPLLSDQTPWRGLQAAGAGWDLPLADADAFRAALGACVAMDDAQFRRRSVAARELGERFAADPAVVGHTRRLFVDAAKSSA